MKPRMLLAMVGAAVLASGGARTAGAQAQPDTTGLARAVGTFAADSVIPRISSHGPVYVSGPMSAFDSAVAVTIRRASPRAATFTSRARPPAYDWTGTRGYSLRGDSVAVLVETGTHNDAHDFITTYIEENLYLFVRDGRGWRFVRRELVRGMDIGGVREDSPSPTVEQDEREVLLVIIQYMENEGDSNPIVGVMTMEKFDDLVPDAEILEEERIRFPLEVFRDLMRRNERSVPLRPLIGESARVRWITRAQADSLNAADGPGVRAGSPVLERIYPGVRAIDRLSRPGFDKPRRHAAVAYAGWCPGGLCGSAGIYLLKRRFGRWRVIDRLAMVVS